MRRWYGESMVLVIPPGKKGQFDVARKTIYWGIAGFTLSIVIVAFAFIISSYAGRLTSVPPELTASIIALRFTNIPECFAYKDEITGRVYPGIIDLSKFTNEQMAACYVTDPQQGHRQFNFQLELGDKSIKTNNYYQVSHLQIRKNVLVKNGNAMTPGELLIHVQIQLPYRPSSA